jgi:lambda family phage tail tape measure protein
VATEEEIVQARIASLRDLQARGIVTDQAIILQAEKLIQKEAKQTAEALQVRQAALPNLKQFQLDSANLNKALDQFSTGALNSVTDELAALTTGTKTASQAFSDMTKSILNDLAKLLIRQSITGPLAGLISGAFGGGGVNADGSIAGAFGPTSVGGAPLVSRAGGGYTGPGGRNEPAGIVHRGEVVFSQDDVRRFGGADNVERIRRGYADGGIVGMPSLPSVVGPRQQPAGDIIINNYTDAKPTVQRSPEGDISITIRKMVDAAVGESLSTGTGRRVLDSQFGVKPFTGR